MFNVITGIVDDAGDGIRRAVANLPGQAASFRVQPDQVFALANRFDAVADSIQDALAPEIRTLWVPGPGADTPSQAAAERLRTSSFGEEGLVSRLHTYASELRRAADGLRQTGRQYGLVDHTEGARLGSGGL